MHGALKTLPPWDTTAGGTVLDAVRTFHRSAGLVQDGIVGANVE